MDGIDIFFAGQVNNFIDAQLGINRSFAFADQELDHLAVLLVGGQGQRRQQEALAQLSDLIQEDLSGINAIKIYGQEAIRVGAGLQGEKHG